jgi:hypothetical protein
MIQPDFRALCAELLSALEAEGYEEWSIDPEDRPLCERARAALATPPPEPPTDEELDEFAIYWWGPDTDERTVSVSDAIECCNMVSFARAVLERWGNQATITQTHNN